MPEAYIMLNIQDAENLVVKAGTVLEFSYGGRIYRLPVRLSYHLAPGQLGLPLGMPGIAPTMAGMAVKNVRRAT